HESHGTFPPGRLRSMTDGHGRCFSAYAYLLPTLDADELYSNVNFDHNPEDAPNATVLNQTISYFLCPSDQFQKLQGESAVHNYPLNTGTTYPLSPRNPAKQPVTGIFFENSKVRVSDIVDGASHTVCVAETIKAEGGPDEWDGISPTNGFVL